MTQIAARASTREESITNAATLIADCAREIVNSTPA
jgi:hypothetical protein